MQQMVRRIPPQDVDPLATLDPAMVRPGLLRELWRQRWCFVVTVLLFVAAAVAYVLIATPVYVTTARVAVQNGMKPIGDDEDGGQVSDGFVATQADAFLSLPVLKRATDNLPWRSMKVFSGSGGQPALLLRYSPALKVQATKKSPLIILSLEAVSPNEAVDVLSALITAFTNEQTKVRQSIGGEMLRSLQKQRDQLATRRDEYLTRMLKAKQDNRLLSFKEDTSNSALGKLAEMNKMLIDAEVAAIELRAEESAVRVAMGDSSKLSTFLEAQQLLARDHGDREYDDLRSQLGTAVASLEAYQGTGPNNPRTQSYRAAVDSLKERLAAKEGQMASAQLLSLQTRLVAAELKEKELRAALSAHETQALAFSPIAMEYAKAEAASAQLQRQVDQLDARISEVTANTQEVRSLNVRVIDPPRAELIPVKPKKSLVIAAGLLGGIMAGLGLSLLREWRNTRLRSPREMQEIVGFPVLATLPRMEKGLPAPVRGQIVRLKSASAAAEAYRSVSTCVCLGPARESRAILVASPAQGDGKSTTASNLAIALAQAGQRVLLIDCDLRRPVQHAIFETDGAVGLSTLLSGKIAPREAIIQTAQCGLHLLPAGPLPPNPSELIGGDDFKKLLQELRTSFDRIVLDSPALMRFNDARILAASADATLLVLRINRSLSTVGTLAVERLSQVGAQILGTVANDVPSSMLQGADIGTLWGEESGLLTRQMHVTP
jgi:capsular exopolysaccharide synthesis family protein